MSEAKKATSKGKHRDGTREGQSHNISTKTKKEKSSSRVKVKLTDPASPADKLMLLSGTQVEDGKSVEVEDFFNLPKHESKTPPWPKSDVEGWNLTIGSVHTVQIIKNMSDIEFPMSKFPASIQLKSKKKAEYADMWKELQAIYTPVLGNPEALVATHNPEGKPWKGQFVVIWHTDVKKFSRAVVKRGGAEDGTFIALSIDFKRFVPVHKKHMYLMCSKFMGLRPRAVFLHMDAVHHFSRSPALQKLISSLTLSPSEIDFIGFLTFVVTRHETEKFIFGDLYENSESLRRGEKSVNIRFMEKLWVNTVPPSLPKLHEGRLQCFVVHAEKDGTIYLQLTSPIWHALQDYIDVAEKKLEGVKNLQIESELDKYKVSKHVDPKIIYMLHYKNIHHSDLPLESDDGRGNRYREGEHGASTSRSKSFKFYRVQVAQNEGEKKSLKKPGQFSRVLWTDVVRFKFIDFGFEETINITEHFLVKSMKLHPFLDKIPPQSVKTRLANIAVLDVDRFYKEVMSDAMSVYILTVAEAEGDDGLSQVLLYTRKKTENPIIDDFANVNDFVLRVGIAQPQPSAASNEVLAIKSLDDKRLNCMQLEYIEMKETTDWGDNYSSISTSKPQPVVPLNFHFMDPTIGSLGIDCQVLRKGGKIWFFVGDDKGKCYFGKTWKHFVIQTVYAQAEITKYSKLINAHVSKPWILTAMAKKFSTKNYLNAGWFYSFYSFQKGCFVRARLLSDVRILPIPIAAAASDVAQAGSSSSATDVEAITGNNSVEHQALETETGISVRMLLIDYAEELEVPVKDLLLSIPLNVCGIGPMAAKVSRATLDNSEPHALLMKAKGNNRITGPRFQDRFEGKKCTAIVKRVEYDRFGVAKLQLDRMQLAPLASAEE